jgi:adenylate cyclase
MATEDFKRKLTAVMSADVAGYSRLMAEDEAATVKTIATYREVMATLIKQHRGRVVDSPGDNVLAEFASVVDAVQCAVAVQKEFQARNAELPENRRMEFRIGINLGDVIEEEERIYGDGVNIAARLEALADPGGICVSKTAFDQIETKLPLGYEYLGEQDVKNIPKPVGAYRVLMEPRITVAKEIEKEKAVPVWRHKVILAGGIVLILLVIAALIWNFYFRPPPMEVASLERMAFPLPDKPSIAVLPFKNLSGHQDQEYLADGITENIITALSKTPKMFVIASNSVFTYKDKPVKVQQVAEELGVRYVLEGSVQRLGDRLRLTAQLIDAIGGHHLWAERYDRDLKNLFALQDEMTMKILTAMEVKLTEGEAATSHAKGTDNLEAYLKDLQGREHLRKMNKDDNALARKLLEEAIALDPEFASPHVGLSYTHMIDVSRGWSKSPRKSFAQAEKLAQKALALDDSLDMAYALAGRLYCLKRQYEKAISEGEKAVALGPNNSGNMAMLASTLRLAGKAEDAVKWAEKAVRLNPKPPLLYLAILGYAYGEAGRYEDAITTYKKVLKQNPNFDLVPVYLSAVYMLAGHEDKARTAIEELLKKNPNLSIGTVKASLKRRAYKSENMYAHVIEALRKAGLPETPPLPLPDKPSIAVLPFTNMSDDPGQEFFSDGITEEIITALSKTPKLFVIARNSSFTYKGKSVWIPKVGRELGVKYVLEGSVRKAGDRVRITAQLVDAKTAKHLWADRWDRELEDIFAVQDEITKNIITAMQVQLTEGERARLSAKGTDNLEAYLKYIEGRELVVHFNKENNVVARRLAEEAIALDPQYSHAVYLLGLTHMMDVWLKATKSPKQSIGRAMKLAQKAIALDSSNAGAYGLLGFLLTMARQHERGIAEAEKAISLDPNSDKAHQFLGLALRFGGRPNEAIPIIEKAIRLNPFPPSNYIFNLGLAYLFAGQHEAAIKQCKKATDREPNNLGAHLALAAAYSVSGRDEEAQAVGGEILRIEPKFSVEYFSRTLAYKNQADKEIFITALRKAGLK